MGNLKNILMGNEGSNQQGTRISILLDRHTSQAGSALRGKIVIYIGNDGKKLAEQYPSGIVLEAQLFGCEKVYWAVNLKHQDGPAGRKQIVPGGNRRERANILIDFKQQLAQLSPMEV